MLASIAPTTLQVPHDGLVVTIIFLAIGIPAACYAGYLSVRDRDPLPVLCVIGAMLAVLAEATFDELGHIWYPENIRPRAFTMLDRPIPAFLIAGYIPWVGVLPVILARAMQGGIRRTVLWSLAVATGLSNVAVDAIGTSAGAWSYYADGPLHYLTTAPILAALPILEAWLILTLRPRLPGWRVGLLTFVPPFTLSALFAGTGWPMYAALNIPNVPYAVQVLAGLLTIGLVAAIVWLISDAVDPAAAGRSSLRDHEVHEVAA
ncbi:MAG: hypothetical protein JWO02_1073 [Solirubrobacterales bacterium]|nr:hypothetical protein [Solirubrobacterales bacterium]